MVFEIIVGVLLFAMFLYTAATNRNVAKDREDMLKRVIALENAMAAVEKSCTISSDTIAKMGSTQDARFTEITDATDRTRKQAQLAAAHMDRLSRELTQIRVSLAHANAQPRRRRYHEETQL